MHKLQKIMTTVIAAAILFSGSVVSAGAAEGAANAQPCSRVTVVRANNTGSRQSLFDYLSSHGFDINRLLRQYRQQHNNTCPNGNCLPTAQPTQPATKPTPAQTAPSNPVLPADAAYNRAFEDEVIRLVNAERAPYGLPALQKNDTAVKGAEIRAKEITGLFSHTRPNGTSCFTVCKELGISYRSAGENIAYGQRTPQQVVNGWMNSEGHRKNILSASFTSIGVGCYRQGNTLYWSQLFIG